MAPISFDKIKFQLNQHRDQHQVTSGAFRNSERLDPDWSDVQHLLRQDPTQLCQHGPLHPQTGSCGKFIKFLTKRKIHKHVSIQSFSNFSFLFDFTTFHEQAKQNIQFTKLVLETQYCHSYIFRFFLNYHNKTNFKKKTITILGYNYLEFHRWLNLYLNCWRLHGFEFDIWQLDSFIKCIFLYLYLSNAPTFFEWGC